MFGVVDRLQHLILRPLALTALIIAGASTVGPAAADSLKSIVKQLGGHACRTGELTCVEIQVPVDHFHPGKRMAVEFAVHFAAHKSKGLLFYVVGGPGGSGIEVADDYLGSFDERLSNEMDIVFFDQRGIGPLSGLSCAKSQAAYDQASLSPDRPEEAVQAAKDFVAACVAEMAHADLLPYLDTEQAIRDLEAFRRKLGSPKAWIYGESYGTQFAQQYAVRYPGAVNGVIIDGVVDLGLDADGYYSEDVRTVERLLQRVFESCDTVADCRADMAKPAAEVYDDLAKRLETASIEFDFPLADGATAKRQLTSGMLDADGFYALYGPDGRAQLLRVLAAASRGDLVPMLRLSYSNLALDPETLEPVPDPTWYGAAYYGITCPDYGDAGSPDPEARVKEILDRAKALGAETPRLIRSYFAERLACVFWPAKGRQDRPKPFTGGNFPTLVLNSTADPATPISNGYTVFDRLRNASMVTMEGGPHVILGRGLACPDRIAFGLMLDRRRPEVPEQICHQPFLGTYAALTLTNPDSAADPLAIAKAVETEIGQSPQLYNWDGETELTVSCDRGGAITISAGETGTDYVFKGCSWWQGIKIDGAGRTIDAGDGTSPDGLTLNLDVSGAHQGSIHYRHDTTTEAASLDGTFDGKPVKTPRPN